MCVLCVIFLLTAAACSSNTLGLLTYTISLSLSLSLSFAHSLFCSLSLSLTLSFTAPSPFFFLCLHLSLALSLCPCAALLSLSLSLLPWDRICWAECKDCEARVISCASRHEISTLALILSSEVSKERRIVPPFLALSRISAGVSRAGVGGRIWDMGLRWFWDTTAHCGSLRTLTLSEALWPLFITHRSGSVVVLISNPYNTGDGRRWLHPWVHSHDPMSEPGSWPHVVWTDGEVIEWGEHFLGTHQDEIFTAWAEPFRVPLQQQAYLVCNQNINDLCPQCLFVCLSVWLDRVSSLLWMPSWQEEDLGGPDIVNCV